ncbi:molybdopterin-dependent oxidoreductase [Ornithinimicrobium murale]|uniref:molybdopterin-dependent oxidoreductase n=1 Tax=Ornithinimicrobium murale TaxID=1050153 RepID=UPI00192D82CD|nr:molybdopterin-dependent oxidoreductase [Ornithinimicrobium murale]
MSTSTASLRALGAVSGLVAATAGVLAAHGVAALLTGVTPPVTAVGNRAIDWTPQPVKEWAIETFGAADKTVLVGGVLVTVALLTGAAGAGGVRRRGPALALMTGLVALASAAMLTDRTSTAGPAAQAGTAAVLAVVGIGGLWWLLRALGADAPARQPGGRARDHALTPRRRTPRTRVLVGEDLAGREITSDVDRRRFLQAAGALAAVGAAGGAAARMGGGAAVASRDALRLPAPAVPARAVPGGVSFDIPGLTPHLTPNADFYRVDTALTVPDVPLDGYRLRIHGLVDNPLELTFQDLLDRRLVERRITLTCVSNPVGGDLVDNASWLGVPMRELLAEAGVREGADAVRSTSADGFTAGTPLEALTDDREALVAIGMNGEPLPLEHGFPVRMVTPGLYGYVSATKWLVDLEVTRFADFSAYWTSRGYAEQAPIKLSSRIDVPGSFEQLGAGQQTVAGVAWAQPHGIDAVEVRVDGGDWQQAELAEEDSEVTWRPWRWDWPAEPGTHRLEVRASDRTGETQTSQRAPVAPDGSTGWHSVTVTVS